MFDDSMVSYKLECMPEDTPVRGNAMNSGDADFDRECEDKILADLEGGNDWAWCCVRVTATYDGIDCVVGMDYLNCCSYNDEEDFKAPGGYYDQIKEEARDDLYWKLGSVLARFGRDESANEPVWKD